MNDKDATRAHIESELRMAKADVKRASLELERTMAYRDRMIETLAVMDAKVSEVLS